MQQMQPDAGHGGPRRWRSLIAPALAALLLHGAVLGGLPWTGRAEPVPARAASLQVRAVESPALRTADPAETPGVSEPSAHPRPVWTPVAVEAAPVEAAAPAPRVKKLAPMPRPFRSVAFAIEAPTTAAPEEIIEPTSTAVANEPAEPALQTASQQLEAAALPVPDAAAALQQSPQAVTPPLPQASHAMPQTVPPPSPHPAAAAEQTAPNGSAEAHEPAASASTDEEIPLYRTRIPPAVTLHYEMIRGLLRGSGELQWRPSGDTYALQLEGRLAGFTILRQTSQGGFDEAGLAPLRFTDQRLRGQVLATNFRRDSGRITFSGPSAVLPLPRGTQDRLSWMIQLAAILSAEPGRLVPGGLIAMPVVGARADMAVWTLRYVGHEDVATGTGTVHAVKLARAGRERYDTGVDVWLDPQRDYLPIRATLHNGNDSQTLELVLHDMVFTP